MTVHGSYANGFAPRDGQPLYPELWRGCVGAWAPCLGPTGLLLRDWSGFGNHGALTTVTASSFWTPYTGGYSGLLPDSSAYVSSAISLANGPYTLSWWERPTTSTTVQSRFQFQMGSGFPFAVIRINVGGYSNIAWGRWDNGNSVRSATAPTIASQVGLWSHWLLCGSDNTSLTPGNHRLFVNGVEYTTTTSGAFAAGTNITQIGSNVQSQNTNAALDDIMIFRQSLPNLANILSRRRGIAYELAPRRRSSVLVAAAFNRRRRLLIGAGA